MPEWIEERIRASLLSKGGVRAGAEQREPEARLLDDFIHLILKKYKENYINNSCKSTD